MFMLCCAPPAPCSLLLSAPLSGPNNQEIPMKLQIRSLLLTLTLLGGATAALAQEAQDPEQPPVLRDAHDPSRFNESRLWLGVWAPSAKSDFWDDNFKNFKGSRGGLTGYAIGGDYVHHFDRHDALMLSAGL